MHKFTELNTMSKNSHDDNNQFLSSLQIYSRLVTYPVAECGKKPEPNCLVSMKDHHCCAVARSVE